MPRVEIFHLIRDGDNPTPEQIGNAGKLLVVVNAFSDHLGLEFICTSGIRTLSHHMEIYKKLQKEDAEKGRAPRPIPLKSSHLAGNAIDFKAKSLTMPALQKLFCPKTSGVLREDLELLAIDYGAWFEMFSYTPTWIHLQRVPPLSGKRFFRPF